MQFKEALIEYLEANDIKFSDKDSKHDDNNMSAFIKLEENNEFLMD